MKKISLTQGTREWLDWRLNGITATEATAALGVSKWSSPLDVYTQKLNPQPHEPSKYEEWGTLLEDTIKFKKFAKMHPEFEVKQGECYEDEWRKCSLDGELWHDGKWEAILEIKTGRDITAWDPVPEYYMAQVQWQMHVTGIKKVYFAVLINGCDYLERVVEYDPQYCEELEVACAKLWKAICDKEPPAPTKPDIDQPIVNESAASCDTDDHFSITDEEAAEFHLIREQYEKYEALYKQVKLKLSAYFAKHKRIYYKDAVFGTFVTVAGKVTVDSKLLQKNFPEVYAQVIKTGKPSGYPKFL